MSKNKQLKDCEKKSNSNEKNGNAELFGIWFILLILNTIETAKCEIEPLMNCDVKNICNGKIDSERNSSQSNSTLSGGLTAPCYCDKQCLKFGDCCVGKLRTNWTVKDNSLACTPISFNESVFSVSNCAFDAHSCKRTCEKNVTVDDYHYILDIPVFSNRSGLYYANIYCAHCHNQLAAVNYPKVTISCTSNITIEMLVEVGKYQQGKLLWKVGVGYCILHVHDEFQRGKQFVQHLKTICRINSESKFTAKSRAHSSPMSVSDKFYCDPLGAICNGAKISDLQCENVRNLEIFEIHLIVSDFRWKFDRCNNTIDFVWDNIHRKCININCTSAEVSTTDQCTNSDSNDLSCQIIKQLMIRKIDAYILRICLLVSLVCLLIHIFMSFFIPQPRNVSNKLLDTLALCSVGSQLLFLTGIYPPFELGRAVCYTISVLIQFSNISTFFWTNAISFDVFYTFSDSTLTYAGSKKYSKYALYAWGGAALTTLLSVIADFTDFIPSRYRPNYASKMNVCWFGSRNGLITFFYVPMSAIILCNTFLFVITVCWFQKQHRSLGNIKKGRKEYNKLCLYFKLSIIMGASWIIALLRFLTHHPIFRYLFTAFSGLQGAFIFIMFDMKKEAKFILLFFRRLGHKQNANLIQSTVNSSARRSKSSIIRAV